jgi:transcriptional repressor NrdR
MVIKKNGSKEYFNKKKIKESLSVACNKRPMDKKIIDDIVENIERTVHKRFKYEVPTSAIGNLVLTELKKIDQIAYIRFASVYREFKDVVDFVQEIKSVTKQVR